MEIVTTLFLVLLFSNYIYEHCIREIASHDSVIVMDEVNSEQDHGETFLKVTDDKKRRWNSFRKGKKQIKKLWKSKKASKLADEDRSSYSEDSHENMANDDHMMSESMSLPRSTTSSHDPIPSIMLHLPPVFTNSSPDYMAATTDEDDSSRESHNVLRPKSLNTSRSEVALSPELSPQQESNVCRIIVVTLCEFFIM